MSTIFFSSGDKGGVGKSVVSASIIDVLLRAGRPVVLVDADPQGDQELRFSKTPNVATHVINFGVGKKEAMSEILDFASLLKSIDPTHDIVVNLPGGASETVDANAKIIHSGLSGMGLDVRVLHSMGGSDESVRSIERSITSGLLKGVKPGHGFVVLQEFTMHAKRSAWLQSNLRREVLAEGKYVEIKMPEFDPPKWLDGLPTRGAYSDLVNDFDIWERAIFQQWIDAVHDVLSPCVTASVLPMQSKKGKV